MKRGTIVILIILAVAVISAGASVWYHYRNQHRAQQFWGTATAVLIDKAPTIEVLRLGEPDPRLALGDDAEPASGPKETDPDEPRGPQAVEFNQTPWIVVDTKDAAGSKGVANLRRALVLDTTFDWDSPPPSAEPKWQYGVSVNDGKNWATVLFDFDTRQVGLTGGRKTALLEEEANREFEQFFAEQLPEKEAGPAAENPQQQKATEEKPTEEKPAEEKPAEEKPAEPEPVAASLTDLGSGLDH